MTRPFLGQGMPANDGWIARRFEDIERALRELRAARTLDSSTISPNGTLHVDGTVNIAGNLVTTGNAEIRGTTTLDGALTLASGATLTASGDVTSANYVAGTSGWKLDGLTGNLEINDVTIRGGIVGDDALANPIKVGTFTAGSVNSVHLTTTNDVWITKTIPVPAGFSTAVVYATTVVSDGESGTASSLITAITTINGVDSPGSLATGTGGATAVAPFSVQLTGLSGGVLTIEAKGSQGFGTTGFGSVSLNGFAIFLR